MTQATTGIVLILESDRLYADLLRRAAKNTFPHAELRFAGRIADAATTIATRRVELLITGTTAPDGDTLDLLYASTAGERLVRRVLVVTVDKLQHVLMSLRALPIDGVFDPSSDETRDLVRALQAVGSGKSYWSQSVLERLRQLGTERDHISRLLTPTEQLVLAVAGDGADDQEAGRRLGLEAASVSSVRRALHRKLGVRHNGELVRVAVQCGFVRLTPDGIFKPGFAIGFARCRARRLKPDAAECEKVLCAICPAPWCGRGIPREKAGNFGQVEAIGKT